MSALFAGVAFCLAASFRSCLEIQTECKRHSFRHCSWNGCKQGVSTICCFFAFCWRLSFFFRLSHSTLHAKRQDHTQSLHAFRCSNFGCQPQNQARPDCISSRIGLGTFVVTSLHFAACYNQERNSNTRLTAILNVQLIQHPSNLPG